MDSQVWNRFKGWLDYNKKPVMIVGSAVLVIFAIVWSIFFFWLNTHKEAATIDSFHWSRRMDVQDFQPRERGDWDWDVPSDAYNQNSYQKYHHTEQIYAGENCSGSGETRSCTPIYIYNSIYRTWTDYTVDRWEFQRWLTSADFDQAPYWPKTELLGFDDTPVFGHERLGSERIEEYVVYFKQDGRENLRHKQTNLANWSRLKVGDSVTLNINHQGDVRSVNWPKEQVKP
jgi:hypothetical protein